MDKRDVAISSTGKQHSNAQTSGDDRGMKLAFGVTDADSSQQPLVELNVIQSEEKIVGTSEECIINLSTLPLKRGGIDITLEELLRVDGMKRKEAAERLNVSISTFKRACRHYNISRWPPHKRNTNHQTCSTNSAQTSCTVEPTAPTMRSETFVTIKAKYGDKFIKFQLSASCGIDAFHHQVSKRLKLEAKDYIVSYQDEDNDSIILACDDDLHYFISSSTSSRKNAFVVTIEHT